MSKPAGERYTIAVDFDGVIHSYTSPWLAPDVIPDPPVDGAIDWLNEIGKHFDIVIFTTRGNSEKGRMAVLKYLKQNGYYWVAEVTDIKPPALIYLDDKAVRFNGPGDFPSKDQIHALKPWNKK